MIKGKKIADYINEETVNLDLKSKVKNMVIKELYGAIKDLDSKKNKELGLSDIYAREELGSTGIGKGVALPHAKTKAVDELVVTLGISKNGIEYDSLDEENVKIFFMFLCPEEDTQEYLKVLARISRWIKEDRFRESLLKAKTGKEIIDIIKAEEV